MLSAQLMCGAFGSHSQSYRCLCLCSSTWFCSVSFLLSQWSHLLACTQCYRTKANLSLLLVFVRVIANRIQLIKQHLLCNCVREYVAGTTWVYCQMAQGSRARLPMQEMQETRVRALGWGDPLEKAWQPTSVFLPGKFHAQRSLVGYSPWDCKASWTWLIDWACTLAYWCSTFKISLSEG